ncbi:hypothetical protein KJ940_15015, partial [Myxococcota bacterium]|nr:hypothetical protein [Myxococcota bacterium]
ARLNPGAARAWNASAERLQGVASAERLQGVASALADSTPAQPNTPQPPAWVTPGNLTPPRQPPARQPKATPKTITRELLDVALQRCAGRINETADYLGLSRHQVRRLCQRLDIDPQEIRARMRRGPSA